MQINDRSMKVFARESSSLLRTPCRGNAGRAGAADKQLGVVCHAAHHLIMI